MTLPFTCPRHTNPAPLMDRFLAIVGALGCLAFCAFQIDQSEWLAALVWLSSGGIWTYAVLSAWEIV